MKLLYTVILAAITLPSVMAQPNIDVAKAMREGYKAEMLLKEGDDIIDFELKDIAGNPAKTSELRKGKMLLVRFMSVNAGMTGDQIRIINILQEQYRANLNVLDVIDKNAKPDELLEFYEKNGAAFLPAIDTDGAIFEKYEVKRPPAIMLVDKNGKLSFTAIRVNHQDLTRAIEKALKAEQE